MFYSVKCLCLLALEALIAGPQFRFSSICHVIYRARSRSAGYTGLGQIFGFFAEY
jgi:hypothetical protein